MPQSGELNHDFGVYRSLCCSVEIAINADTVFPACPNHPNLTTVWKLVSEKKGVIQTESKPTFALEVHITNRRLFDFAAGKLRLELLEGEHLHQCKVCSSIVYIVVNQLSEAVEDSDKPDSAA